MDLVTVRTRIVHFLADVHEGLEFLACDARGAICGSR